VRRRIVSTSLPGRLANRFDVHEPIGQGGMGIVYRGIDHQTSRAVAIKTLRADASDWQPTAFDRFQREAELLRQLNHPNIIETIATFAEDDRTYIVMEFAEGGSLAGKLTSEHPLPVDTVVSIALDVADAMTRVHRLGILHRDLKPENVLLTADGSAKLTDFGIAYLTGRNGLTQDGGVLGTVAYLSPEALSGEPLDARSDVWAFGVVLFEMLAGRTPFSGEMMARIVMSIMTDRVPDLEALRPDAPVALIDLVYRMLEKDPAARLRSVRLAGAELEALLDSSAREYREPSARSADASPVDAHGAFSGSRTMVRKGPPTNLPAQSTPFIGRQREMSDLSRVVSSARLTTVTGAGGSGKTRVIQELGAGERDRFDDGVFFVPLAPLREAENIVTAIADAVGLSFKPGIPRDAQLLGWLAERRVLLILDNFEHLLDGAPLVSRMLDASPNLTVVATSREPLGLASETVFRLEGVDSADGIELFLQSGRRAFPGFTPSDDDRAAITSIGQVVGGNPLAILLAASWVEMLGTQDILREIRSNLDFLESDGRHVDDRHRSMRVVFDTAWQRLSSEEQDQFARMAAFRGGFTREAAHAITGASLRSLSALVRHSLLRRDPSTGRYDIHELLRQYAERRLMAVNARDDAERRHASYCSAMLNGMEQRLVVGGDKGAVDEIEGELDNIRAAWDAAMRLGDFAVIGQSLTSLATFYGLRTMNEEALSRFSAALDLLRSRPDDQRPLDLELGLQVRSSAALMNLYGYGHPEVEAGFTRALALCQRLGPSPLLAPVMFGLWAFYLIGAHYAKASALAAQLLDIGTSSNDNLLMIGGHHATSSSSATAGELSDAVRHAMCVKELYRPDYDPLIIAYFADHSASASRGWHAVALNAMGQIDRARVVEREMREFFEGLGHGQTHAQGLMLLFLAATIRRDDAAATETARDLRRLGEKYGLPVYVAFGDAFLATVTATPDSLGALVQASHVIRDMFGFKAMTVHVTMLRRAELELAMGNARAARATAEEALAWVRDRGEYFFESEALRTRGDAERALGDVAAAEASYRAAIEVARGQEARLFELRAANSLSRLCIALGRSDESRAAVEQLLVLIPGAADFIDARESLELLATM
jgi:serine/threonine protein kinase/predicted ATPase